MCVRVSSYRHVGTFDTFYEVKEEKRNIMSGQDDRLPPEFVTGSNS